MISPLPFPIALGFGNSLPLAVEGFLISAVLGSVTVDFPAVPPESVEAPALPPPIAPLLFARISAVDGKLSFGLSFLKASVPPLINFPTVLIPFPASLAAPIARGTSTRPAAPNFAAVGPYFLML